MVLSFKAGTFTKQGSTGTQAITGVGFIPKAMILLGANVLSINTFEANNTAYIGFASSSSTSKQRSLSNFGSDNANPSNEICGWRTNAIWNDIDFAPAFTQIAVLDSFNADGFTLDWTTNDTINWVIGYLAFGGDDITHADVGSFNAPSTTGSFAVTGLGFKPDFIILLGTNFTSDNSASDSLGTGHSLGVANISLEQAVTAVLAEDNVTPTDTARYQRTSRCLAMFDPTDTGTLTHEASIVSMDSNGFTLNFTTASGANRRVAYLALKGGKYKIGSFNSPTAGSTPVSQSISTVGFQPKGLLFQTVGIVASSNIQAHWRSNYGAVSSASSRFSAWSGTEDADTVSTDTAARGDNNECIRISDEAPSAPSSTTQGLADITSLNTNGFTLSWSTRDSSNAYQVIYTAFGNAGIMYERDVTGVVTINANVSRMKKVPKVISDTSVEITASVAKVMTANRSISESFGMGELIQKIKTIPRAVSEVAIEVSADASRFMRVIREVFPIAGE